MDEALAECLERLLQRQREEVSQLEDRLAQAQGLRATVFGTAEARTLEEEIATAQRGVSSSWLYGPAASIEHEVARRRHLAKVCSLEQQLAETRRSAAVASWSASSSTSTSVLLPAEPLAQPECWTPASPAVEVSLAEVVAERRRRFGDRLFRLWVEDCAHRGGVRVHALDTLSYARVHTDLRDSDVQAMYDYWWYKSARRGSISRFRDERCGETDHGAELQQFLCCLLDAVYFEGEVHNLLELRVPLVIEPPRPPPERILVEVPVPQDSCPSLSKRWTREKMLVHRNAATRTSSCRSADPSAACPWLRPRSAYAAPQVPATSSCCGSRWRESCAGRAGGSRAGPGSSCSRPQSAQVRGSHPQPERPCRTSSGVSTCTPSCSLSRVVALVSDVSLDRTLLSQEARLRVPPPAVGAAPAWPRAPPTAVEPLCVSRPPGKPPRHSRGLRVRRPLSTRSPMCSVEDVAPAGSGGAARRVD